MRTTKTTKTTKRAGQGGPPLRRSLPSGEPTSRSPSPENPGALSLYDDAWLQGRNVLGLRDTLEVLQDDLSERHEMLDAFDAAFSHAPKDEDEWTTMARAAGAVREVKAWYGR